MKKIYIYSSLSGLDISHVPFNEQQDGDAIHIPIKLRSRDGHPYFEVTPFSNVLFHLGISVEHISSYPE